MGLTLNEASFIGFSTILILLVILSIYDLRERRVPNQVVLISGVIGGVIGILTGHIVNEWMLHLSAIIFVIIPIILYRVDVLGGADVKAILLIAIVSPGIEFTVWDQPYFEAIIAQLLQILIMLFLGFIWSRVRNKEETRKPALIPLLLVGYLIVQLLAFI
jgi:Flp pilus assembly protein protease CpaA